jgi:tetratricopeptide (TPR) repeat protein
LGNALMQTEGYASPATYQCYVEARQLASDLGQFDKYIAATASAAPTLYAAGKFREVIALLEVFSPDELRTLSSVSRVWCALILGSSKFLSGELVQGLTHLDEARQLDDAVPCTHTNALGGGDPAVVIRAYSARACAFLGFSRTAGWHVTQGLEIANRRNHAPTKAWAVQMCAWISMLEGDFAAAMGHATELLELSERLGLKPRVAWAIFHMGRANVSAGKPEVGIPQLRQGYALWASTGGKFHCSELASYAADHLLQIGRAEEALEFVVAGEVIQQNTDERMVEAELLRLRGRLLELQHAPEAAERAYRRALEVSLRSGVALFALRAATAINRLLHAAGREDEARAILEPLLKSFPEPVEFPDILVAKQLLLRNP